MELKDIDASKLSGDQRGIIEAIGLEGYARLVDAFGGKTIYITKPDGILRESRNKEIRNAFDGGNYWDLAKKYNLSEVAIRLIVAEKDNEMRKSQIDGQEGLFAENNQ